MSIRAERRALLGPLLLALASPADAHSFAISYTLPVPFWLYAQGALMALLASFVLVAHRASPPPALEPEAAPAPLHLSGRVTGLGLLALCIATGLFGTPQTTRNFSMTFFWIILLLGVAYLTPLLGDRYARANPWRALTDLVSWRSPGLLAGRRPYPGWLGDWPAVAGYLALIWLELFGHLRPAGLAWLLLANTLWLLAGSWWFGASAWLRHADTLGRFFALLGRLSPWRHDGRGWRLTGWGAAVYTVPTRHLSEVVLILALLSTTAFDGLQSTAAWTALYWRDTLGVLAPLTGQAPVFDYARWRGLYMVWESACLLLSPLIYLACLMLTLALTRRLLRTSHSLTELACRFAPSLLPIALVYHVSHYFTLLLSQGTRLPSLTSDPFGWGWDLLGLAERWRAPILLDMSWVWHLQVALILAGHIASVRIAHREALRVFGDNARATVSQLPLLALMMLFTWSGLWILAQPLQAVR